MGKTILLTGATGYIGSVVAERLLASGYTVHGLVRSDASAERAAKRGIVPVRADLNDTDALEQALGEVDAVVHTATTHDTPTPNASVEEATDKAAVTLRFLAEATASRSLRFISTSGTGIYGDTGESTADEDTAVPAQSPFGALAAAELSVLKKPHASIVRPALVYGRAASPPVLGSLAGIETRGRAGYVQGDRVITIVHVDDLADLFLLVLEHDGRLPLVIGAGDTLLSKEVMAAAGVAAGVGEGLDQVTNEVARSSFGFLGYYLTMNMRVSGALARDTFGWQPRRPSIIEEFRRGSYCYLAASALQQNA